MWQNIMSLSFSNEMPINIIFIYQIVSAASFLGYFMYKYSVKISFFKYKHTHTHTYGKIYIVHTVCITKCYVQLWCVMIAMVKITRV